MRSVKDWSAQGCYAHHRRPAIPPPLERSGGIPQRTVEIPEYALIMGELAWKISRQQGRHSFELTDFVVGSSESYRALIRSLNKIFVFHTVIDRPTAAGALLCCSFAQKPHREAVEAWPEDDRTMYVIFAASEMFPRTDQNSRRILQQHP